MLTANNSRKMHAQVFTTGRCWLAQKKKNNKTKVFALLEKTAIRNASVEYYKKN